jgi:hypothetical protein
MRFVFRWVRKWVRIWVGRWAWKRHQARADKAANWTSVTGEQFGRNVKENCARTLGLVKTHLADQLYAQPPAHPGNLFTQLGHISQYALELAMLDWREGKDPRPHLDEMKAGFDQVLPVRPDILHGNWDPGFMPIVSSLRDWGIPLKTDPPAEDVLKYAMLWMERWIVAGLTDPSCWPIKAKAPATKHQFINKCLDDYWTLLTDQIDPDEGIRRCIQNYDRRATHQTFKSLPGYLGGGQYNALFVDYTLAAILKQRGLVSHSVHDWVWG